MKKIVLCACLLMFSLVGSAGATELVDSLSRTFKKIQFPHDEVMVKIEINTRLTHLSGNKEQDEVLSAWDVHKKTGAYLQAKRLD